MKRHDNRWHVRGLREHFVYAILDADGKELYIGRSMRPEQRWTAHLANADAEWTSRAASFRKIGPFLYLDAVQREKEWIQDADPIGNYIHTSRYVHPITRKRAAA